MLFVSLNAIITINQVNKIPAELRAQIPLSTINNFSNNIVPYKAVNLAAPLLTKREIYCHNQGLQRDCLINDFVNDCHGSLWF